MLEGEEHIGTCLGLANAFSGALYNLAGNAVKFTDQGIVVISMTFRAPKPDQVHLKVAVTDTGIGIAPEDQSRIFAEFETLGGLSSGRESGTGLGLPIARQTRRPRPIEPPHSAPFPHHRRSDSPEQPRLRALSPMR